MKIKKIQKLSQKSRVYDLDVKGTHNFFISNSKILTSNCDGLTADAQRALRNTIEEYAHTTRFIITGNYKHKIIPAIQSRCQTIDFGFTVDEIVVHCYNILKKENIRIPNDQNKHYLQLIRNFFPDLRKIINELQKFSTSGLLQISNYSTNNEFLHKIWDTLQEISTTAIRQLIIENEQQFQGDYQALLKSFLNFVYKQEKLGENLKRAIILTITEYMYRASFCMDQEINAFACFLTTQKQIHNE